MKLTARLQGWVGSRAIRCALFVALMLLQAWQLIPALPREVTLSAPSVLMDRLPLRHTPSSVHWSPDGRFLAVLAVDSPPSEVAVVDTTSGKLAGTVQTSWEPLGNITWSSDNSLWVQAREGWEVYRYPFKTGRFRRVLTPRLPSAFVDDGALEWTIHPDSQLIVAAVFWTDDRMKLMGLKAGEPLWEVCFEPRETGIGRQPAFLRFSPDGTRLALTVGGPVAYETPGRDELWMVETATGKVQFLHAGENAWWELFECSTQDVRASWTPDSQTIVFGDSGLGVESINVKTRKRKGLLPAHWGEDARAGRNWIAYARPGDVGRDGAIAVVSHDCTLKILD